MAEIEYRGDQEFVADWFRISSSGHDVLVYAEGPEDKEARDLAERIGRVLDAPDRSVTDEQVERACALAHGIVTGEGGGSGWFSWQEMIDYGRPSTRQMLEAWRKAMRAVLESGDPDA